MCDNVQRASRIRPLNTHNALSFRALNPSRKRPIPSSSASSPVVPSSPCRAPQVLVFGSRGGSSSSGEAWPWLWLRHFEATKQRAQPRSRVGAGPSAQRVSHPLPPPLHAPRGLHHPRKTLLLHFGWHREPKPDRKAASFPRPDVPHITAQLQRTGSRYQGGCQQRQHRAHAATALRTSCCSGTNGCGDTGHVKRTERRSV